MFSTPWCLVGNRGIGVKGLQKGVLFIRTMTGMHSSNPPTITVFTIITVIIIVVILIFVLEIVEIRIVVIKTVTVVIIVQGFARRS